MNYVDMDDPSGTSEELRVANCLQQRIPDIVDVTIDDPFQLTDEANEVW
jgi:hypothetical protein